MSRRKSIPVDKKPKEMFSCHASFHTEANQAIKSRVHEYQTGYYRSLSIPFYEIPLASDFGIYAYVCGCKNPDITEEPLCGANWGKHFEHAFGQKQLFDI